MRHLDQQYVWFETTLRLMKSATGEAKALLGKTNRFCPNCGIHPYGEGKDREGNAMAAINVRCLDEVDLDRVAVSNFDGRAL